MTQFDIYVSALPKCDAANGDVLKALRPGIRLTLATSGWAALSVRPDDEDFRDGETRRLLHGAQPVNGVSFPDGTVLEALRSLTLEGGGQSWSMILFRASAGQGHLPVEGLAFAGSSEGFPPSGVPLELTRVTGASDFAAAHFATPVCVAEGTMIETTAGLCAIEDILPGDAVITRDHGPLRVCCVGKRHVEGKGRFAPVIFETGAIGNDAPLVVSQEHHVVMQGWQAEMMFGSDEVMIPAVNLVDDVTIRLVPCREITYHFLLLEDHAVLRANGAWTESFAPEVRALRGRPQSHPILTDARRGNRQNKSYPITQFYQSALSRAI